MKEQPLEINSKSGIKTFISSYWNRIKKDFFSSKSNQKTSLNQILSQKLILLKLSAPQSFSI